MTRRSSVRAQAQRIYRDSAQANKAADPPSLRGVYHRAGLRPDPLDGQAPTPDPPSLRSGAASPSPRFAGARGGGEKDPPSLRSGAPSLTARVRALYEDSAVPVREIAKLAGVTERTIYKYAAKHAWKPRYRWSPDRSWRARAKFAPAKGAGARFIRREDKGQPFATGLKATDPAGAAQAAAECRRAQAQAGQAQAEAEEERRFEAHMRAHAAVNRALDQLQRYQDEQAKLPPAQRAPADDPLRSALCMSVDAAREWWGASGREYHAGKKG